MFKQRIIKTLTVTLIAFLVLSGLNVFEKGNFDPVGTALAFQCNDQPIQIMAGTSGTLSVAPHAVADFAGGCLPGFIQDAASVTFNQDPNPSGDCNFNSQILRNYVSTTYDATAINGLTVPQTYTFTVEGVQNSGGECVPAYGYIDITILPDAPAPDFSCSSVTGLIQIDPGSDATPVFSTTGENGFNSPVHFNVSIEADPGTPNGTAPTLESVINNDQIPSATTSANFRTSAQTTAGSYTVVFSGSGGGQSHTCRSQIVVNSSSQNFNLTISPAAETSPYLPPENETPNRILQNNIKYYNVFAECTGGFAGPVTNLEANISFAGPIVTLDGPTLPDVGITLACGSQKRMTVTGTGFIDDQSLSSPSALSSPAGRDLILRNIVVTGRGLIN